jgi:catechol 2,3-dioxygenase-like lactoylglutathione lyase family enzyme
MKTRVGHIQFNIARENLVFYRELLPFLGQPVLMETPEVMGAGSWEGTSLWFWLDTKAVNNDYDGPGMNHIGIETAHQADVDEAAAYLRSKGVALLFGTPQHRPEFAGGEGKTYYQVMFESPDRILFEVVYSGAMDG